MNGTDKKVPTSLTAEVAVIRYAREHEKFSRPEIDTLLGTSPATSNRILKRLVEEEKLVPQGKGKALTYRMYLLNTRTQ